MPESTSAMNRFKYLLSVLFFFAAQHIYAGNPVAVQQFINHKDWNFVENKGQLLEDSTPCPRQRGISKNSQVKYYSHSGGAHIYCRPGMISFVFTKVETDENV